MLLAMPQKGDKLLCVKHGISGLTKGKEYEVVYRGDNHFILNDDNDGRYIVTIYENMENFIIGEPQEAKT